MVKQQGSKFAINYGISSWFRTAMWSVLCNLPEELQKNISLELTREPIPDKTYDYISRDIKRTFPETNLFSNDNEQQKLYRILHGLAVLDDEMLYCQGMNYIAGIVLLVNDFDESVSFYQTVSLFSFTYGENTNLRNMFIDDFPLVTLIVKLFFKVLKRRKPNVAKKIEQLNVPTESWIDMWVQTCLVPFVPHSYAAVVIDNLILKGPVCLVGFCYSLIESKERSFMKCTDQFEFIDIIRGFKYSADLPISVKEFVSTANEFVKESAEIKRDYEEGKKEEKTKFSEKKYEMEIMIYEKDEFYIDLSKHFDFCSLAKTQGLDLSFNLKKDVSVATNNEWRENFKRRKKRHLTENGFSAIKKMQTKVLD